MADTISYIKVGSENHPIDAITVNGITLTSAEKTVWNNKQDALTFDSIPTENSGNPITSGGIYNVIKDNEYVIAAAINDLNTRLNNVESGEGSGSGSGSGITSESDPVFASSPAAGITAADISSWRSMSSGGGSGITSESDPVFSASVAASITASDISNWNSKTSNTGTITGISMNGSSKGTSGNINLGNVVTAVSFNGTSVSPSGGVVTIAESDPVFAASVAASISATDISNWNNKPVKIYEYQLQGAIDTSEQYTLSNSVAQSIFDDICNGISPILRVYYTSTPNFNPGNYFLDFVFLEAKQIEEWWYVGFGCSTGGVFQDVGIQSAYFTITPGYSSGSLQFSNYNFNQFETTMYKVTTWSSTASDYKYPSEKLVKDSIDAIRQLPEVSSSDVNGNSGKILVASYDSVNGYHWDKSANVTLYYNGSLTIPGSVGDVIVDGYSIKHNSFTNWDWIQTGSGNSLKTLQDDLDAMLPAVSSSNDIGQILVASYDSISGYHWEKAADVTLCFNGSLAVPGSIGTTYMNTGGVYRTDRSSWDWIRTGTTSSSLRTLQSDLDAIRQLPAVSSTDNGKILQVVNGQWTLVSPVNIYSGNGSPNNSQGDNGDLYLQTS